MKKILLVLFCSIILLGNTPSISLSQSYAIRPLTTQYSSNYEPKINEVGEVVWWGNGGVHFYNGTDILQLSTTGRTPKINDSGHVVWDEDVLWLDGITTDSEIFLYDGFSTTQITDNDFDDHLPQINNSGIITWDGWEGSHTLNPPDIDWYTWNIYMYDGISISKISDTIYSDMGSKINATGDVIWTWQNEFANSGELYLYDGISTILISDNVWTDYYAYGYPPAHQIHDNGLVAWQGYDSQIYLYDGSITQLTSSPQGFWSHPQINTNGDVVWHGLDPDDYEIFLYNGSSTTQITNNDSNDMGPQINDNGKIVWGGSDESGFEIFLYDGVDTVQVTFNDYADGLPQINNNGDIVWVGEYTIFLAKACSSLPVKQGALYYPTIQDAYLDALGGETIDIQAHAWHFTEDPVFSNDVTVTLGGGYDCDHTETVYQSSIHGSITISNGMVVAENVVIQ